MGTALALSESETDIHLKAASYRLASEAVDGMDVVAVEAAARRAVHAIRETGKPYFLECRTYRFRAHSMFDAQLYRDKAEGEAWRQKGPIARFRGWLESNHMIHPEELARIEAEVAAEIARSHSFRRGGNMGAGGERHALYICGKGSLTGSTRIMPQDPDRSEPIELSYREAVREAIRDALIRDQRVFLMGEDVGRYGGCYAVSKGLLSEFGAERIRDTPLSESAFTGAGIGAAIAGMRPIVELMTVNFSLLALDQILNTAATIRHMSGNQFGVPLVIRMATGAGRQLAAQHSHSLEGWYAHIPGIKVLAPATIEDARGMLWTALEDPDPVLIFENIVLYNMMGKLPADAGPVEIAKAAVRREGRDISLITYGGSLWKTLEAASLLAAENIEAEVIDLRSLRPLDDATIMASVSKTRRAIIVDEGWRSGSISAEICTRIVEQAFWELDAPLGRVCSEEVPIPYPRHLEQAAMPAGGKNRRSGQSGYRASMRARRWLNSACPRSVPIWKPERLSSGWSNRAIASSVATLSPLSKHKKELSRSKSSRRARLNSFWSTSAPKCLSGRHLRKFERSRKSKPASM